MIQVFLLGRFRLLTTLGEVRFPTAKSQQLAAYFFWTQGQWAGRDFLCDMLWNRSGGKQASGSLRTALHMTAGTFMKYGLPQGVLEKNRNGVRITEAVQCRIDARLFEKAAGEALHRKEGGISCLQEAVSLYTGDFIADMDAQWCTSERSRLSDLYIGILQKAVERLAASGEYECAIEYACRWCTASPLDESAHQALIRLYAATGRPVSAARQFEECRQILKRELNALPSEATLQIYHEIGHISIPTRHNRPDCQSMEMFSAIPLRNARFMLANGKRLAEEGFIREGMNFIKKSLELYEKWGSAEELAKAWLWAGSTMVRPTEMKITEQFMPFIKGALDYYRREGPDSALEQALLLGANLHWMHGELEEASDLAREGLKTAEACNDHDTYTSLLLVLGMSLRDQYRLQDAAPIFRKIVRMIPGLADLELITRAFQNCGVQAFLAGELPAAKEFLEEALTAARLRGMKGTYRGVDDWINRVIHSAAFTFVDGVPEKGSIPPDLHHVIPQPMSLLLSLYTSGTDKEVEIGRTDKWLRDSLHCFPWPILSYIVRLLVERMLSHEMDGRALNWTALGIHHSRKYGYGGWTAVFYTQRAVIHARCRKIRPAECCLQHARELADKGDRWTPAWMAYAAGMIAKAKGDYPAGRYHLKKAVQDMKQIGDLYDAGQIQSELEKWQIESPYRQTANP